MKVDFWQVSHDPVEQVASLIAQRSLAEGQRVLVVSGDAGQRARIGTALWEAPPPAFLANGEAGATGDAAQPVLLSGTLDATNGARFLILADGVWPGEGALAFERTFLLFDENTLAETRDHWRAIKARDDVEARFFKQVEGRWTKAG